MLGLFVVFLIPAAAQHCSLNNSNNGCVASEVSSCVSTCSLYKSNNSCSQVSDCLWANGNCSLVNASLSCSNFLTSGECAAEPLCNWHTIPCKFVSSCESLNGPNFTCYGFNDSSTCTANGCGWRPNCQDSTVCGLTNGQQACRERAGCFWGEAEIYNSYSSFTTAGCAPCFADPSNTDSNLLQLQARIGQICDLGFAISVRYLSTTPAASGCSGGMSYPDGLNCNATKTPTTTAPSKAPSTLAPTRAPSNTEAPTTPVEISASSEQARPFVLLLAAAASMLIMMN